MPGQGSNIAESLLLILKHFGDARLQGCYHQLTDASRSPSLDVWDISPPECERGGSRANKAGDSNKATLPSRPPLSFNHPFLPFRTAPSLYPRSALPPGPDLQLTQVCQALLKRPLPTPLTNPGAGGSARLWFPARETGGPCLGPPSSYL